MLVFKKVVFVVLMLLLCGCGPRQIHMGNPFSDSRVKTMSPLNVMGRFIGHVSMSPDTEKHAGMTLLVQWGHSAAMVWRKHGFSWDELHQAVKGVRVFIYDASTVKVGDSVSDCVTWSPPAKLKGTAKKVVILTTRWRKSDKFSAKKLEICLQHELSHVVACRSRLSLCSGKEKEAHRLFKKIGIR